MNKKVLTLCAGFLLAGAVGTVSAQSYATYATAPTSATEVTSTNYYQLKNSSNEVLAMVPTGSGNYELKMVSTSDNEELRYTLWGIIPSGNAEAGYSYSFVNYATNLYLAVNSDNAVVLGAGGSVPTATSNVEVGGNVNVWKWVSAPDLTNISTAYTELTSSFGAARDSVVILSTGVGGYVEAVKYAANEHNTKPNGGLKISPANPAAVALGIDDLNSMLWKGSADGKLKLTFDKDVEGGNPEAINLFTNQEYKAVAAVGYPFNNYQVPSTGTIPITALTTTALAAYEKAQHQATLAQDVRTALGSDVTTFSTNASTASAFANAIATAVKNNVTTWNTQNVATEINDVANISTTPEGIAIEENIRKAFYNYVVNLEGYRLSTDEDAVRQEVFNGSSTGIINKIVTVATPAAADAIVKTYTDAVATTLAAVPTETNTNATAITNNYWVSLQAEDGNYLMVDTAYMTSEAGNKYLKFSQKKPVDLTANSYGQYLDPANKTRLDINGRYNFQFVWFPAKDSISIRTAGYAKLEDDDRTTKPDYFKDLVLTNGTNYRAPQATDHNAGSASGNKEQNLVKIQVLANNHREVTVGNSEFESAGNYTINTRISANANSMYELTTLPSGVYFFNLSTDLASKKYDNGKYYVAQFCGDGNTDYEAEETTQLYGVAQDFGHMPRTQWVVEQNPGVAGQQTVNIYNREFPTDYAYTNVQLYKGGDGKIFARMGFANADTLSYALAATVKPNAGILTNKYLGYYKPADENQFQLNRVTMDYFSGIEIGNFVNVSSTANDTTVFVDVQDGKATFQLVPSPDAKYGYEGTVAPQLYRRYYTVKVYDNNKLVNNAKWIARDADNENTYKVTADEDQAVKFYLKENNQLVSEEGDTTCYYALVDLIEVGDNLIAEKRVGVRDGSLKFTIEDVCSEERVAAFAVKYDESIIYRELNGDETVAIADGIEPFVAPCVANFYRARIADKQYLFESLHQGQFDEAGNINYLGVRYQGGEFNDSTAIYVDTADVRNPYRPQYMLAVGTEVVSAGKYCPIHGFNSGCLDEHLVDVPAQVWGRYLINAQDSLANKVNGKDYLWENQYTRLAFVEAMHTGDTLVIFKNGEFPLTSEGHKDYLKAMEWARNAAANTVTPGENDHVYVMNVKDRNGNNATKTFVQDYANYKFMFRLVDDADARNFIIESHDGAWGLENNTYTATENNEYRAIKIQNGVPVIARLASASEGILNAEWWNIDDRCSTPTANEEISANTVVSVVATDGAVIVKGAEGKNVVVSTILGKVVANEVLNSDNETIAAPAGIVVVSVDGESFKVAVK